MVPTVVWFGIITTGGEKSPPRAHARLVTEKGLSEKPLCGLAFQWGEEQPTRGRCRRCQDLAEGRQRSRHLQSGS